MKGVLKSLYEFGQPWDALRTHLQWTAEKRKHTEVSLLLLFCPSATWPPPSQLLSSWACFSIFEKARNKIKWSFTWFQCLCHILDCSWGHCLNFSSSFQVLAFQLWKLSRLSLFPLRMDIRTELVREYQDSNCIITKIPFQPGQRDA